MASVGTILRITLGWLLIAIGVVAIFIPVMPQIPFLAVGALLLAPYVRVFRRLTAWFHKRYPGHRPWMRRFRPIKKSSATTPPGDRS